MIRRIECNVERELKALSSGAFPQADWTARMLRSSSLQLPSRKGRVVGTDRARSKAESNANSAHMPVSRPARSAMIKPGKAWRALGSSRIQNNQRKVLSPRQHALLLVRSPVRFASTEELIHSGNEVRCGWRSRYASGKDPFEGNCVTIHGLRVRAVLVNNVTVQVDPGK